MESPEQRHKTWLQTKFKRMICKEAIFSLGPNGELQNDGCKNQRANGSSRCQKCSLKEKEN